MINLSFSMYVKVDLSPSFVSLKGDKNQLVVCFIDDKDRTAHRKTIKVASVPREDSGQID